MLTLSLAVVAHAEPTPAELEKQIDDEWNKVEPLIEQHNQVRVELEQNRAKVAQLSAQIQPLQLEIDVAQARVSALAVRQYKLGRMSSFNALLTSGSPTTFADQLTNLEMIAHQQREALADVVALRDEYEKQKRPLDQLVAKLAAQEADLAAKKKKIDEDIKNLNDLRLKAYGTSGALGNLRPVACPTTYPGGPAATAARVACNQIGKPYIWATAGPNTFDCSGLTMYAWAAAGVTLRHYTRWQWDDAKPVSRSDLRVGDLVFYFADLHHMAMYVGTVNGVEWVVHAPQTGDVVRMKKMADSPIAGFRRPG